MSRAQPFDGSAPCRENGYYALNGEFTADPSAPPMLVSSRWYQLKYQLMAAVTVAFVTVVMFIVTLAILTFRMLMKQSYQFADGLIFNR